MTAFLLFTFVVLLVIGWLTLREKINATGSRLLWQSKQDRIALEGQIAELAARIWKLEQQSYTPRQPEKAPQEPVPAIAPAETAKPLQAKPVAAPPEPDAPQESHPLAYPAPDFVPVAAGLTWSDRLRQLIGDREWETLVAGSVMNKIGALLVVIGIALFLGYSINRVNPAGRAAVAALVSVSILAGGIVLERRGKYRVFSRSLIGAGWAAVYTTAYAMYALPSARVISNPFAGSMLLIAVSVGMIAHSLRYRAQALTAVAYFSAFAAFAVTPSTPFAVVSVIPLAASLLYFAWRFEWHPMALFGLFATYATCVSRSSSNAPLYATTSLFIVYWLLFESFDILRSGRRFQAAYLTWIFSMNTIAFLGLAYQGWAIHLPHEMWRMAAVSAILFFASAMVRLVVLRSITNSAATDPFDCVRRGSYEAPLTIAAVLAGLAILGRTTGFCTNVSLAFEAEIFYLAGVRFKSHFLRALGVAGFAVSLGDLLITAAGNPGKTSVIGVRVHTWTPSAIVHAFLFYANYALSRSMTGFAFAATALTSIILTSELKPHIAPLALFLLALMLFEIGVRKLLFNLRVQSYLASAYAAILALWAGGFVPHAAASIWVPSAMSGIACWLFTAWVISIRSGECRTEEVARVRDSFAIAGSAFAMLTLWMLLPGAGTAAAWTCLALAWLGLSLRIKCTSFRWVAAGVMAIAYVRLVGVNLITAWPSENAAERWLIPIFAVAALYYFWHEFRHAGEASFAPVFTWFAVVAALCWLCLELDRPYIAIAWGALALVLLVVGLRNKLGAFRWQAYVVFALSAGCCVFINFAEFVDTSAFARTFGASLLIALLFAAEFLLPRDAVALGPGERHARTLFSVVAVLLLTGLLYREVSGAVLTVAWGLEAVACLGSGFPARERLLRLQGLALFTLCVLKLFLYDLRNLETAYRILSFIALGVILLSVSWIYTRFRVQIQRYL